MCISYNETTSFTNEIFSPSASFEETVSNEEIRTESLLFFFFLLIFFVFEYFFYMRGMYKCCESLNLSEPFSKDRASQILAYVIAVIA